MPITTQTPATREKLLAAAIRLFAEKGPAEASTAEISKAAGVATGTLFNHFSSKTELIEAVYFELKSQVAEQALGQAGGANDPRILLRGVWTAYIRWALEHPAEHSVLGKLKTFTGLSAAARARAEEAIAFAVAALARSLEEEGLKRVPLELAGKLFTSAAEATIEHLSSEGRFDPQVADISFNIFWDGLKA